MKQFKTILKFEFLNYLKNKIFVGITLFLIVAIALVMYFPNIKQLFISDTDEVDLPPFMLLSAADEDLAAFSDEYFRSTFTNYAVVLCNFDEEMIKEEITENRAACAFYLTGPSSFTYYVNNLSMTDTNPAIATGVMQEVYRSLAMIQNGLSPEQANEIMSVQIDATSTALGKDQAQNFFYTYIMIFALYMVILLYGQMVATNVASEKSSRAMELLVTSAKPVSMMFGKVMASCLAGLLQLLLIFGSSLVFYNLNKSAWEGNQIISSIFNIPPELLGYMLVFFVLGFLIYAFLFGATGSMASKLEDINTSCLPLMFMFVIAFMVVMTSMGSGTVDNTAMIVCSYIPFTSPMAMFTRIAMSTVPTYEILISIGILIGSVIGTGVLSAKIYRVGVLLYGKNPSLISAIAAVFKS